MSQTNRTIAMATIAVFSSSAITGCGGAPTTTSYEPPQQQYRQPYQQPNQQTYTGTEQQPGPKAMPQISPEGQAALLVGAAAMYYMLKKNQEQREKGQAVPQYYLSKNGGVYYRDKSGTVHWVQAPAGGLRVPEAEAKAYDVDEFKGYNGRNYGRGLSGLNPSTFY